MQGPARPLLAGAALLIAGGLAVVALREGTLSPAPADARLAPPAALADRSARRTATLPAGSATGRRVDSATFAGSTRAAGGTAARLRVRAVAVRDSLQSFTAMPGEAVPLSGTPGARLHAEAGTVALSDSGWTWTAPATPGEVRLTVHAPGGTTHLVGFVLEPYDQERDTVLRGYVVGRYGPARRAGDPSAPPRGLIRVTEENQRRPVSPHFRLGDFLCRQASGWPKFVLLDPRLLDKLERLHEASMARGYGPIRVMSGFRTPWYNRSIGNVTTYSHHLFGRAADVYVDRDGDGSMDDLDGDGQVTEADAERLEALVLALGGSTEGGTGLYAPAAHRGPFVHVDVGGRASRWQQ